MTEIYRIAGNDEVEAAALMLAAKTSADALTHASEHGQEFVPVPRAALVELYDALEAAYPGCVDFARQRLAENRAAE